MTSELQEYFRNMFLSIDENIVLDEDQISAITDENKYTLILAGAGTGKTTTMVGKVKYLVEIKKVDPSKILVISYTKKAVEELQRILIDEFKIDVMVTTFHSLAYKYVRKMFDRKKCVVVDYNLREKIFYDYLNNIFKEGRVHELIDTFNKTSLGNKYFKYGTYFLNNYSYHNSYDSFFEDYKIHKISEALKVGIKDVIQEWIENKLNNDEYLITLNGEIVKSVHEAIIANYLFIHGIEYQYEKVYVNLVEERKTYKPDFTLDLAGNEVYLEYFGLDDKKYQRDKERKIELHKKYNTRLIYIENVNLENIELELDKKLKEAGFLYKDRSDIEIYTRILENNKLSQVFKLKKMFYECVDAIKESVNRADYDETIIKYVSSKNGEEQRQCNNQYKFIKEFYEYYINQLNGSDIMYFDYSDLIYFANLYIKEKKYISEYKFEYVVIDEYQDISDGEYSLVRGTSDNSDANVFAVGDDWQSIYSFRGSKIEYITNFEKYFEQTNIKHIRQTYRNSQELLDTAKLFIEKNPDQIKKELSSQKHLYMPIKFIEFQAYDNSSIGRLEAEYDKLKEIVTKIHTARPEYRILILTRYNKNIENCFKINEDFIDGLGTKVNITTLKNLDMDFMTIHKSKGLTYDVVILVGINDEFPKKDVYEYWLSELFKPKAAEEGIEFAEERRLFYVALTRTKNQVFVLYDRDSKYRSKFVDEISKLQKETK